MSKEDPDESDLPLRSERPNALAGPHWQIAAAKLTKISEPVLIVASAQERDELARELNILSVGDLRVDVVLSARKGGRYRASGTLKVQLEQASVVSLQPVPERIEAEIACEFWPPEQIAEYAASLNQDAELDALASDDPEPLDGDKIDIGRLVYELVAVSLDPYPRLEAETFEWADPGKGQVNPFALLKGLGKTK